MLKRMEGLPAGIVGVQAEGRVTPQDYVTFLAPLFEEEQREGRRIRFLYHLGREFSGFTAAAIIDDFRLGLRYAKLFEKCAVVSDVGWIRGRAQFVAPLMPCPVLAVPNAELGRAIEWLAAPAGHA